MLLAGVLPRGDREALRLARVAGKGQRRRVLRVVGPLRRRHVGETRRHLHTPRYRLVQCHREGDRLALFSRGVLDRHRRAAVVVVDRPRRRVARRHRRRGLRHRQAHREGLVRLDRGVLGGGDGKALRLPRRSRERQRRRVLGIVGALGRRHVGETRRHLQPARHRVVQGHREGQIVALGRADVFDRHRRQRPVVVSDRPRRRVTRRHRCRGPRHRQAHRERLVVLLGGVLRRGNREALSLPRVAREGQHRRVLRVVGAGARPLCRRPVGEGRRHLQTARHRLVQCHPEGQRLALFSRGVLDRHRRTAVVVGDRPRRRVARRHRRRGLRHRQAHRERLVRLDSAILRRRYRDRLLLPRRSRERQRRRVLRVVRPLRRRDVGEGRRYLQAARHRVVQGHREGQRIALRRAHVPDRHRRQRPVVVGDRPRRRVRRRHRRRRPRHRQAHRERFVVLLAGVLRRRDREALRLPGRPGKRQRRRVLRVVRPLGCGHVGETGSHLQAALHRLVQRHREGDGLPLFSRGVLDRHLRAAVVVTDRPRRRVARRHRRRGPRHRQAHRERLVRLDSAILRRRYRDRLLLPRRSRERQRRRVLRVVRPLRRRDVGEGRRYLQAARQRVVQGHREGQRVALRRAHVPDRHRRQRPVVVGDRPRRRVTRRHRRRRPRHRQAHRERFVVLLAGVLRRRDREALRLPGRPGERQCRRILRVVRPLSCRHVGETGSHLQAPRHRLVQRHRERDRLPLLRRGVLDRHLRAAVVVGDRPRRRVARRHRRRGLRHRQAHRERLVRLHVAVLGGGDREALRLARRPGKRQRRRVLRVIGPLRRRPVREGRRHLQPARHRLVQRHREGQRVAFRRAHVPDRHRRQRPVVVGDRPRRRVTRRHRRRRPRHRQAHRERFVVLLAGVLRRRDREALRLPGRPGKRQRRRVLRVVRPLGRRPVREGRRHLQSSRHRLVQRHRKRDRLALFSRGVLDRHRRAAVVVGDRPRRRIGRRHRHRRPRHLQAHRERLIRLHHLVFCRGYREALRLARRAGERQLRRVLRVVRTLRRRPVGEGRRHLQPVLDRLVQLHREGQRIALRRADGVNRHPRSAVVVVCDRPRRRIRRDHAHRGIRHRQAHRERLVRLDSGVLGSRHREGLRLARVAEEVERGRVLGVVRPFRRRPVGERRCHRQTVLDRLVQLHRKGQRIALGGRSVINRHHHDTLVGDRPRRCVRRRHRRRRGGKGEADREGLRPFCVLVRYRVHREGLRLARRPRKRQRRRVAGVVRPLGGRDIGQGRRYRQAILHRLVQRHRERQRLALDGDGVIDRHCRAVVVGDGAVGRVGGSYGLRGSGHRQAHGEGLVGLHHFVLGGRHREGFLLALHAVEAERGRVTGVVASRCGAVSEARRYRQSARDRRVQRYREADRVALGGAGVGDRHRRAGGLFGLDVGDDDADVDCGRIPIDRVFHLAAVELGDHLALPGFRLPVAVVRLVIQRRALLDADLSRR